MKTNQKSLKSKKSRKMENKKHKKQQLRSSKHEKKETIKKNRTKKIKKKLKEKNPKPWNLQASYLYLLDAFYNSLSLNLGIPFLQTLQLSTSPWLVSLCQCIAHAFLFSSHLADGLTISCASFRICTPSSPRRRFLWFYAADLFLPVH